MRIQEYRGDAPTRTITDVSETDEFGKHLQLGEGDLLFLVDEDSREIEPTLRLEEAASHGTVRVAVHPGRQITVTVIYGGKNATIEASPGTKLEQIRAAAIAQLGIAAADAIELSLRELGSDDDLSLDRPVASIAKGRDEVHLQLVSSPKEQG